QNEDAPEALRVLRVVVRVHTILAEGNRTGDLTRMLIDADGDSELIEHAHHGRVEVRHRAGLERHSAAGAVARRDLELVRHEVEHDLERETCVRYWRGGQPSRSDVQRHVPGMVQPRRQGEAYLPDDLRPQVKRGTGAAPVRKGKRRPGIVLRRYRHASLLSPAAT